MTFPVSSNSNRRPSLPDLNVEQSPQTLRIHSASARGGPGERITLSNFTPVGLELNNGSRSLLQRVERTVPRETSRSSTRRSLNMDDGGGGPASLQDQDDSSGLSAEMFVSGRSDLRDDGGAQFYTPRMVDRKSDLPRNSASDDEPFEPSLGAGFGRFADASEADSLPAAAYSSSSSSSSSSMPVRPVRTGVATGAAVNQPLPELSRQLTETAGLDAQRAGRVAGVLSEDEFAGLLTTDASGQSELKRLMTRAIERDRHRARCAALFGYIGFGSGAAASIGMQMAGIPPWLNWALGGSTIGSVGAAVSSVMKRGRMGMQYIKPATEAPTPSGWNHRDKQNDVAWVSFSVLHALVDTLAPYKLTAILRAGGSGPLSSLVTGHLHGKINTPVQEGVDHVWLDAGDEPLPEAQRTRHFRTASGRLRHAIRSLRQESAAASLGYVADMAAGVVASTGIPERHTTADALARTLTALALLSWRPFAAGGHSERERRIWNVGSDLLLGTFWGVSRRATNLWLGARTPAGEAAYPFVFNPLDPGVVRLARAADAPRDAVAPDDKRHAGSAVNQREAASPLAAPAPAPAPVRRQLVIVIEEG